MIHAALGLATEAGEVVDEAVKAMEENRLLDHKNLLEELSDSQWYTALAIDTAAHSDPEACQPGNVKTHEGAREWSYEAIWEKNLAKLKARYPGKFATEQAYNRNKAKESEALEGKQAL